jgi:hypothetical protein
MAIENTLWSEYRWTNCKWFLTEQGSLLTSAIIAVVQALRENPDKYAIIFDNSNYDNSSEYHEALWEVASSFLNILSNQIVDKTKVAAVQEK